MSDTANAQLTHTATLVYGQNYIYRGVHFKEGEARKVTAIMAAELEVLEVNSRDTRTRAEMAHPRFEIAEIGADLEDDEEVKTVTRSRKPSRKTAQRSR